ncbi:MAG: HD domain-containing protein [Treponema sp.]|nr:HD domain-containing protein [Treponema sp.]
MRTSIHPILKEIASFFNSNKKDIYLVGGAVRDMLRGEKIHDWDLATNAIPEEVTAIARRAGGKVIPTGIKHGTVTVFYKKHSAEITTFRTESDYSDGRRPDQIYYAAAIEEDLSRRDFTMNAIALRLPKGEIVDPFSGEADIKAGIIRCVGNADERFNEDGLRPMRAVRFASQLGFNIEQGTLDAIPGSLKKAANVSWERVRDEIDKILASSPPFGKPSRGFLLMEKTGLLDLYLGELAVCRGVEQKGFHQFDVLDHLLYSCDYAAANNYSRELRLASLFHDVGKPQVRNLEPLPRTLSGSSGAKTLCEYSPVDKSGGVQSVWTFYRHEETSAVICHKILNRLRYSGAIINNVCHLIKEHMFHYTDDWTDAAVRRFIARVGESNLESLYRLRRADAYAFSGKEADLRSLMLLAKKVRRVLDSSRVFTVKDLAVSGTDLMAVGIEPGKIMGIILNELLETTLDDPQQNTREKLLEIAGKIYKERI